MSSSNKGVMSTAERLVYMVNQIARNCAAQGPEAAAALVAEHISLYWDPGMRRDIVRLAGETPGALSPIAAAAIDRIASQ